MGGGCIQTVIGIGAAGLAAGEGKPKQFEQRLDQVSACFSFILAGEPFARPRNEPDRITANLANILSPGRVERLIGQTVFEVIIGK